MEQQDSPDNWLNALLTPLPEEKIRQAINENNEQWLDIEENIARLGSLTHDQIDIPEIRRQALNLLATESKDFRLLVHLLRTLQHGGNATELMLAAQLLTQYVQHYWQQAWPENKAHKIRFAQQVIKRFEAATETFASTANEAQRDAMPGELAYLAKLWRDNDCPALAESADALFTGYQRCMRETASRPVVPAQTANHPPVSSVPVMAQQPTPSVSVEHHDVKSWRATLLNVAGILCERQPGSPTGWRLRRHAIWQNITQAPQAESDGRTALAAFSTDRMADYLAGANNADMALWQQVEQSLILSPYWFDGHALSAKIAAHLGYHDVAEAIRDEVNLFLRRIPQLGELLFNDHTPFIGTATKQWLAVALSRNEFAPAAQPSEELQTARQHLMEQGLEAALRYLDGLPEGEPRDRFLRQYSAAQLMEEAGMIRLAQQHYRELFRTGLRTSLSDWEPALLVCLEEKLTSEQ
ncbi:type VI secretion system protein TssA [Salmonella enterica]|nr:type VI secretion system protein TssA [Salmonella enterica]